MGIEVARRGGDGDDGYGRYGRIIMAVTRCVRNGW